MKRNFYLFLSLLVLSVLACACSPTLENRSDDTEINQAFDNTESSTYEATDLSLTQKAEKEASEVKNDIATSEIPDTTENISETDETRESEEDVGVVLTKNVEETSQPENIEEEDADLSASTDTTEEATQDLPENNEASVPTIPDETQNEVSVAPPVADERITVIDGITYIDGILIVNKTYPLPESYAPQYDQEVLNSLTRMFSAASAEGYTIKVKSGYRSYIDQKIIYNSYAAKDGKALADTYSARPGHSEHQSALAFDLNQLLKSFGDTPEGIWLAENCHKYGFIIRYPKGKEHITGYMYEPWHVRYLGVELATKVYESGLCLEEYLGITSVYSEN